MSVSMSKGPSEQSADARGDLAIWLDNYTAGRVDRAQMQASFLEICRSNPEAPWDALALLDQYQRRGRVDAGLARTLKSDIAQLVFGVVNQSEEDETALPEEPSTDPVAPSSAETTGTRWRRMAAEPEEAPVPADVDPAFVDPMQLVREAPQSRPMRSMRYPQAPGDAPGTLRDRYELLSVLGRDTAGAVYKAFDRHRAHLDPVAQCVALRVFDISFRDSPRALAELEHQFHAAQSLSHPNIGKVFDLDRDGSQYFLVMEFVDGELLSSLLQRLDHHPMPREQALAILGGIGAGLAYAHRRSVVHSDLHPGSIILAANGEPKLLDVGFTRREPVESRRPEHWIGDPALGGHAPIPSFSYASEERVNGESPSYSDDVYSLACIAYEMLAGHHPFGGRSAPLARAHGRQPQRIPGLSGRQWSALQTGLKWSPAERNIDVAGLTAALGCPTTAPSLVPPRNIVAEPVRRRSGGVGVVALVLVLIAGAGVAYWFNRDSLAPLVQPAPETLPAQRQDTEVIPDPTPLPQVQPPASAAPEPAPAIAQAPPAPSVSQSPAPKPSGQSVPAVAPVVPPAASQAPQVQSTQPVSATDSGGGGTPRIGFGQESYEAMESAGSVRLTVKRTGSTRRAVTFHWILVPDSARAGDDFAGIGPGIETIPAGSRSVTFTIPLVSDAMRESTELFAVEISDPDAGAELGGIARATVIIIDDD